MKDKILFVGGTWDLNGGKPSMIVDKFAKELGNVDLYNGGNYLELESVLELVSNYDVVLWWPNVDNKLPKIRNVKEINYKVMLISSKRNDNNKYSFQELLQRALFTKSNLMIEFKKGDSKFEMLLFDPLGNVWYKGNNIKECADSLKERLDFIKNIKRESTVSAEENIGALAWFFNMFKEEFYESVDNPEVPIKKEFLEIVKEYAEKFAEATFHTNDVKRFLGNASFRCPKGFPSFRSGKYIFVSRRNVNKEYITMDEFVPVYEEDNKIYYCGDKKPSVDSPIQIKLYNQLKNINYMIHSHCYIKDAPYTEVCLPCGAIEEINEIKRVIKEYYDDNYNKDFYIINLLGHGSIMMSNDVSKLKNITVIGRELPEYCNSKQLIKK